MSIVSATSPDDQEYIFSIRRGGSAGVQEFRIIGKKGMTVLEALIAVYKNEDPCLGFRYSCTVGRCYSCLVQMNGRTIVSCREPMVTTGALLEPISNRTNIRDLATEDSFARVPPITGAASGRPGESATIVGSPSSLPA